MRITPRAALATAIGASPLEVARAMAGPLDHHAPMVAARIGRRARSVQAWENPAEVDLDGGGLVHPLLDLVLAVAAALREGVDRDRALAPLDYAERLFGRIAVDRPAPAASPAPRTEPLAELSEALAASCDWAARLATTVADLADGHLTVAEERRIDALLGDVDRAAATILRAQDLLQRAKRRSTAEGKR